MKLSRPVYEEFLRQKSLMDYEFSDEQFLAYILAARQQAINEVTIEKVKRMSEGKE